MVFKPVKRRPKQLSFFGQSMISIFKLQKLCGIWECTLLLRASEIVSVEARNFEMAAEKNEPAVKKKMF